MSIDYSDCLLWIGHRYTVSTFIEEARERGCCRKVPQWPAWLKPGKSRIFLAHQDGLAAPHGAVFGYFVLGGVDEVVDGGRGKAPKTTEGDGEYLSEGLLDFLLSCEGEPGEPLAIPRFRAQYEDPRKCGVRPRESRGSSHNPALYLVDSLTRDIDMFFCELVKELIEDELKSGRKVAKKGLKAKARKLFNQAVKKAQERPRKSPTVPGILTGHAETCGTLVLFAEPYPVFHRVPQAAFRGLIEIDGDQLIGEVAETYDHDRLEALSPWRARKIVLPYNHDPLKKLTQAALVEELARECETNKELALSFLKAFENVVGGKLRQNQRVPLSGFGTFLARQRPARKGRNPVTGEAMTIPPRVVIQFRPAEKLGAEVA
jgi:nucleoid DNA-binding protein